MNSQAFHLLFMINYIFIPRKLLLILALTTSLCKFSNLISLGEAEFILLKREALLPNSSILGVLFSSFFNSFLKSCYKSQIQNPLASLGHL